MMFRRSIGTMFGALSAATVVVLSSHAQQPQIIIHGAPTTTIVAPAFDTGYTNGIYSPYPGIVAPVPYPNWDYPPHWIYSYMRWDDPRRYGQGAYGARTNDPDATGRTYRGREQLSPAVPYSEYLKDYKDALNKAQAATKPAPTAEKALLEIRVPVEKARLFFDGKEAIGEGDTRIFLTPALTPGQSYTFAIKATWPGGLLDDDLVSEQNVTFRAGEHKTIDLRMKN